MISACLIAGSIIGCNAYTLAWGRPTYYYDGGGSTIVTHTCYGPEPTHFFNAYLAERAPIIPLADSAKKTELANYVNNNLKLLKIESNNFSDLKINLIIKVKNPFLEKQKQAKTDRENNEDNKKEKKKIKINKTDIFNIDTKNNPCLNKLLSKSLNFSKKNINKCTNPENSKLKIYESIFLGGPYLNKLELIKEENRKNKEQWLNKKGFNPYIGKQTILRNSHTIDNYLLEANQDNQFNFRTVDKSKWVCKDNFNPYS